MVEIELEGKERTKHLFQEVMAFSKRGVTQDASYETETSEWSKYGIVPASEVFQQVNLTHKSEGLFFNSKCCLPKDTPSSEKYEYENYC